MKTGERDSDNQDICRERKYGLAVEEKPPSAMGISSNYKQVIVLFIRPFTSHTNSLSVL